MRVEPKDGFPRRTRVGRRLCRVLVILTTTATLAGSLAASSAAQTQVVPPNDDFAAAQVLSGPSGTVSGSTMGATKEPGEPDHAGDAGGASVWYSWAAPSSGQFSFETCGSGFDTVLAVYTGATLEALVPVTADDDSCDTQSRVSFTATQATVYHLAVDGFGGDQGALTLSWQTQVVPPNDDFAAAQVLSGPSGTVSGSTMGATKEPGEPDHAGDAGGASVWYSWAAPSSGQFSFETCGSGFDTVLAVYTGATLEALVPVTADDDSCDTQSRVSFTATQATVYHLAVDGFGGDQGALTLSWQVVPPNDDFAAAQVLSGPSGTVSGSTMGATKEPGEPDHAGDAGGASVWYSWAAPSSGQFSFETCGSGFDTVLAVYTGATLEALVPVTADDDSCDTQSRVSFRATQATVYHLAVDGFGGDQGALTLSWQTQVVPPNDDFAAAQVLSGPSGTVSGSTMGATKEPGEPDHAGDAGGASVWYSWAAPSSGQFSFETCGSGFDTVLAVYTGATLEALVPVTADDDSCDTQSRVSFTATQATVYHLAVDGFGGDQGALTLSWQTQVVPPTTTSSTTTTVPPTTTSSTTTTVPPTTTSSTTTTVPPTTTSSTTTTVPPTTTSSTTTTVPPTTTSSTTTTVPPTTTSSTTTTVPPTTTCAALVSAKEGTRVLFQLLASVLPSVQSQFLTLSGVLIARIDEMLQDFGCR